MTATLQRRPLGYARSRFCRGDDHKQIVVPSFFLRELPVHVESGEEPGCRIDAVSVLVMIRGIIGIRHDQHIIRVSDVPMSS